MALQLTRELLELSGRLLAVEMPQVEIRFDLKGQAAGLVQSNSSGQTTIRYNPVLLEENGAKFLAQTVPHEVAHVAVACRYRGRARPHGPEWQSVMRLLGAEPRRCHDYDTGRSRVRRVARYTFHCGCRVHQLSAIRRNRIHMGQRYLCRSCGEELKSGDGNQSTRPDRR